MGFDLEVPLAEGDERRQLLNPIGIQVLELKLEMVKEPRMNQWAGVASPRSWNGANETMKPGGGAGTLTIPGTLHSSWSSVLGRSWQLRSVRGEQTSWRRRTSARARI